jgi:hypothetical protein
MKLDLTRLDHLEGRRRSLAWEVMRIKEGTLRTWADYGHGSIETTAGTRADLEENLALLKALNGKLGKDQASR